MAKWGKGNIDILRDQGLDSAVCLRGISSNG
jgi:hypothetical protein